MVKNLIKYFLNTSLFLKLSRGNRFIFVFHDVSDPNSLQFSKHYSTPIRIFENQISFLNSVFEFITLDEIVNNPNLGSKNNYASITFDDGFKSVIKNAAPILAKLNIPYSVFLNRSAVEENQNWMSNIEINKSDAKYIDHLLQLSNTKTAENEDPISAIVNRGFFSESFKLNYKRQQAPSSIYMNKDDIELLIANNITIGNHSCDHFVLSSTDNAEEIRQIEENKNYLYSLINNYSTHFAIPFGKKDNYTPKTIQILKESGYNHVYTTNPNKFRKNDILDVNYLFPRIGLTSESPEQVLFYINRTFIKTYKL